MSELETTLPAAAAGRVSGRPQAGRVELSIVIPVYGCAGCLRALYGRLAAVACALTDRYELVLIDDRSTDGGWEILEELALADARVRAFRLSRNFGQDAAITAGLTCARGDWVVVMDCDLQEAPEDIARMWAAKADGHEIVRTLRRGWSHSSVRRWASRGYRRLTLETDVRPDYSNLSLLSRRVVDAFLSLQDRDREYMIALDWLGFSSTAIEIDHAERHAGKSSYTPRALVRTALDGMFFRSTIVLHLVVLIGFVIAAAGAFLAVFEVINYFTDPGGRVPGYASLVVLLLLLAGIVLVSIGIVGLYVGRVFEQVKHRPLFLIESQADGPERDQIEEWR